MVSVALILMLSPAMALAGPPVITPGPSSTPSAPSGSCAGAYELSQNAIVAKSMARQRAIEHDAAMIRAAQCRQRGGVFWYRRW
jgi:hypothetical protein